MKSYPAISDKYDEPGFPSPAVIPAASSIRDQHIAFVRHYIELGGMPAVAPEAARRAGFITPADPEAILAAAMLLEHPPIAKAIGQVLAQRFLIHAGEALGTLMHLVRSARSESVRLAAAQELLNRSIGPIASRTAVMHAEVTVEDMLVALSKENPERLLV